MAWIPKTTELEQTAEWDMATVIPALESAAGKCAGPRRLLLDITGYDRFGGTSNFLFGAASPGSPVGAPSVHRFLASFQWQATPAGAAHHAPAQANCFPQPAS